MKGIRMQSLRNFEQLVFWLMCTLSLVTSVLGIVTGITLMVMACSAELEKRALDFLLIAVLSGLTARAFWRKDRWKL